MKLSWILFLVLISLTGCKEEKAVVEASKKKPNVLFIAVDDLRPELGAYSSKIAITPNIDKLASQGLLFNNAYCQQAICSPSRASLMTGARPETIGVFENYTYFRDKNPDIITLPQHFKNNGYETVYAGKIYHGKFTDTTLSWSRKPAVDKVKFKRPNYPGAYATKENQEIYKKNQANVRAKYNNSVDHYALGRGPAYEMADIEDHEYIDGYHTELAIATMKDMIEKDNKPFFLGLGFRLPHLDWNAPKKYWDLYDREKIPMSEQTNAPEDGAAMGLHASFELRVRHGIPKTGPIEGELAKTLKHAYLASVSYVDAQIGNMIGALEEAGVRENTIIILWGDHGWHLGDMGVWGKATNYEIATRVPLLIWTPDMPKGSRGKKTDALVELVDMYPTLTELVGLELPEHLEGQSFVPLLGNPDKAWKKAVFSQFPSPALREWAANPLTAEMRETYFGPLIEEVEGRIIKQQGEKWDIDLFENRLMGYSMRTERYRFVAWKDRTNPDAEPIDVELYDHQTDPAETKNIADKHPELVAELKAQLQAGWRGNLAKIKS
ncbi:sulfatase [Maribacter algarum]|uniref:Sulfatase n=1 Tax=Maribacter algarum (ex Zhang et al. 2020) TaxID=2578118 RepID=A0A5S3PH25_9FLAO|nr:sulfatase [Maribacter algarum]TMM53415.1 sulfatase [Maribacter algarum]